MRYAAYPAKPLNSDLSHLTPTAGTKAAETILVHPGTNNGTLLRLSPQLFAYHRTILAQLGIKRILLVHLIKRHHLKNHPGVSPRKAFDVCKLRCLVSLEVIDKWKWTSWYLF
jgi:hypothetical protein